MFFRYIFLILFSTFISSASLRDAIDYFKEGNYEQTRSILSSDSFADNIRAQLYCLAAQGFKAREGSEALIDGLKSHVQVALSSARHEDHLAAHLVQAFWNIYSPTSQRRNLVLAPTASQQQGSFFPTNGARGRDADHVIDMQLGIQPVSEESPVINDDNDDHLPFIVREALQLNISNMSEYMQNAEYFPYPTLMEGNPREQVGIDILEELSKNKNYHGLYFLGSFFLTRESSRVREIEESEKQRGLGCIAEASILKHASARYIIDKMSGRDASATWSTNCDCWPFWSAPKEARTIGCGGDQIGEWCYCGWGLFGFGTRWSFADLCSNIQNISRTTIEHMAAVSGSVLILLQQLEAAGTIRVLGSGQQTTGAAGLGIVLLSYLSAQNKPKVE